MGLLFEGWCQFSPFKASFDAQLLLHCLSFIEAKKIGYEWWLFLCHLGFDLLLVVDVFFVDIADGPQKSFLSLIECLEVVLDLIDFIKIR